MIPASLTLPPACQAPVAFMGFGFTELLLVGFVALLVFGGNLPDVMRQLGRTYGKFRESLHELSRPVRDEIRQVRDLPPPEHRVVSQDPDEEGEPGDDPDENDGFPADLVPDDGAREDTVPVETPPDDAPASSAPDNDDDNDDAFDEPPPV